MNSMNVLDAREDQHENVDSEALSFTRYSHCKREATIAVQQRTSENEIIPFIYSWQKLVREKSQGRFVKFCQSR